MRDRIENITLPHGYISKRRDSAEKIVSCVVVILVVRSEAGTANKHVYMSNTANSAT